MKIYIAGKWESKKRLMEMKVLLTREGHVVVATWLDGLETNTYNDCLKNPQLMLSVAIKDCSNIDECDLLILDTIDESMTGGREVEWGWALGKGKQCWLVGPRRNPFHSLANRTFVDWLMVLDAIGGKS